ncbi:MAG: trypsin-like peptidase domain-containing protein [Paracoccaceae bacterium]
MLRFAIILALVVLALPGSAPAQDIAPDLRGIGLIELGTKGGCTGTLIEPDLVLTAAHCLVSGDKNKKLKATDFYFHPTTITGHPGEGFKGQVMAVHPVYLLPGLTYDRRIPRDLGLLRLERPVPADLATPIPPGGAELFNDRGFVMAFRGPKSVARQRICQPFALHEGLLTLGCEVMSGESGSPFFVLRDGAPAVVSVVSSRTSSGHQPLALSAELASGLPGLLEAFRSAKEVVE